jgi:hypothetical protein
MEFASPWGAVHIECFSYNLVLVLCAMAAPHCVSKGGDPDSALSFSPYPSVLYIEPEGL